MYGIHHHTRRGQEIGRRPFEKALGVYSYSSWSFMKVADKQKRKENGKHSKNSEKQHKGHVLIPHIQGFSEREDRVLKKHHIATAMKPHCTV